MTRNLLVLLLAGVGAAVDVLSYTGLDGVLTANMTGNTILLGLAIGQVKPDAIARSSVALLGYVVGVALGALVVRSEKRDIWSRSITTALVLEMVILGAVVLLWIPLGQTQAHPQHRLVLIGLTAGAMGLQSAAVQSLSIAGVSTTYITGTITTMISLVARRAQHVAYSDIPPPSGSPWLLLTVWIVYLGAAAATAAATFIGLWLVFAVPLTLLGLVILIALMRFGVRDGR